jgi:ribosomal protein L7/L12
MIKDILPPDVLEALKAGNKIEAIKRLRGKTGLGLKEAKDWIESYERGGAAPLPEFEKPAGRDPNASFTLSTEALDALRGGNKIEAIKIIREATGVGLAEAKSIVEEIEKALPSVPSSAAGARATSAPLRAGTGLAPGEVARTGGPGKWLVLLVVVAAALFAAFFYSR